MFGIGGTELVLILLFAFLIFGPDKLPAAGRTIGRAIRQFRNAQDEMNKVIRTEVYDPLNDTSPLKNPFDSKGAKKKSNATAKSDTEETFAERKARMTREKEAARAAREQAEAEKKAKSASRAAAAKAASAKAEGSAKPEEPMSAREKAASLYNVPVSSAVSEATVSGEEGEAKA